MRLICPNCDAQYEVGDDMIPPDGRDVQCSNCAHTWFEEKGDSEKREADRLAGQARVTPSRPVSPTATSEKVPDTTDEDMDAVLDAALTDVSVAVTPAADTLAARIEQARATNTPVVETPVATSSADSPAKRSTVTPDIADILKAEAARETDRRNAPEPSALESQPDLNLQAPIESDESIAEQARARMARLKGDAQARRVDRSTDTPDTQSPAAVAAGARGDLLPDIEEINSSLRDDDTDAAAKAKASRGTRSLFGRGFLTAIVVALVLLALYLLAPTISSMVPPLAGVLGAFVDAVNAVRLWFDLGLQGLMS